MMLCGLGVTKKRSTFACSTLNARCASSSRFKVPIPTLNFEPGTRNLEQARTRGRPPLSRAKTQGTPRRNSFSCRLLPRDDLVQLADGFPHAALGELFGAQPFHSSLADIAEHEYIFRRRFLGFVEAGGPNDVASFHVYQIEHKGYRRRAFDPPLGADSFTETLHSADDDRIGVDQLPDCFEPRRLVRIRHRLSDLTHFAFGHDLPIAQGGHRRVDEFRKKLRRVSLRCPRVRG